MTYISPYIRLDEQKQENSRLQLENWQLKAERDQLLSTVERLEQENKKLKTLSTRWLDFAKDVQPSCQAGEDWLEYLRHRTEKLTKPIKP